ncbi:unnamed protein product [Trypanosoma congolense IL3000]|uniref:WGS project CAEQ00000000 data, annotated contig 1730 n=1 Tax=Trypanosoma congolense (strain IL3000) TaxID=1068625 RepID=F9W8E1_TRYCI|nr:unnamed protein product [Trypanosoma congolense IL3000]
MRVYGLVFVCLSWLALLSGVASSNNDNNGVCKLGDEAAAVLCAIAHLVEKARGIAHNYDHKGAADALDYVKLHKEQLDYRKTRLEELLEEAKTKGTLTPEQADKLKGAAGEAQKKNDEEHKRATEVMANYTAHHNKTKNVTITARGETLTRQVCLHTASLIDILQCHVQGKIPDRSEEKIETICRDKGYEKHISEPFKNNLESCKGIGGSKKYCNGTGAALKEVLEKWGGKGNNNGGDSRNIGDCKVKKDWEKHAHEAKDHMLTLDHILETVHSAKELTTAYLSTVDKMKDGVEKGKPMKEILENARNAGKEGAVVLVAKPHPSTGENATAASETGGSDKVEEEVKVNVKLDGLQFDEDESSLANSKDKFPKYYVYLLAVLVPVCSIALAVAIFCIIRRTKPAPVEKGIPVEGAAAGKLQDGGKTASF